MLIIQLVQLMYMHAQTPVPPDRDKLARPGINIYVGFKQISLLNITSSQNENNLRKTVCARIKIVGIKSKLNQNFRCGLLILFKAKVPFQKSNAFCHFTSLYRKWRKKGIPIRACNNFAVLEIVCNSFILMLTNIVCVNSQDFFCFVCIFVLVLKSPAPIMIPSFHKCYRSWRQGINP